ncbi:hypothetical protein LP415_24705 [Polaromonas sp. P1(28)-8]|nr:hypothetical protein LP415_24705 [Polaromonas sp. P1(28)-8]
MTFADLVLELAKSLAGFLGFSSNLRRARSQDVAGLLERMSKCLSSIAEKLERNEEPVAECHELLYYSQIVPATLRKVAGFWNRKSARHLGGNLLAAVDAPSRAVFNLQQRQSTTWVVMPSSIPEVPLSLEIELRKIKEASGLFMAAAQLVRSGSGL